MNCSRKWVCRLAVGLFAFSLSVYHGTITQAAETRLIMSTYSTSMAWFSETAAIADMISRKTDLDITARAKGAPMAIVEEVSSGMADFGPGIHAAITYAYEGTNDFEGRPHKNMRMLICMAPINQTWVTLSSEIKTIHDLKGKKMPIYTATQNALYFKLLKDGYGIDPEKDMTLIPVGRPGDAADQLGMGRLDAVPCIIGGAKIVQLAESKRGTLRILSVGKEEYAKAKAKNPSVFVATEVRKMTMEELPIKIDLPEHVLSTAHALFAREDTPEDVAYTIVKTMLENHREIRKMSPLLILFSPEYAAQDSPFPYHPGAIRAFKEFGIRTPK